MPGSVLPARVIAEDHDYVSPGSSRPRFVPCQGLSGCARTSPATGDAYPGVNLPTTVDDQIEYATEFVLYIVGGAFQEATFDQASVHIRVRPRDKGFQMVKLDGREVLHIVEPTFWFENEDGGLICRSSWEGCG